VRTSVWSVAGAVLLLVASIQVFNLWTDYRIAMSDTRARATISARILAEQMRSAVATVDASLTQLSIHSARIGGPMAAAANWRPVLTAALAGMSQVGSLTVIDSTGIIRQATIPTLEGQPRRDEFLFSRLASDSTLQLVASTPFFGTITHKMMIPLGRRLTGVGGGFHGIVAATLIPEQFREFYESIQANLRGVIWVAHPTGRLFLRDPRRPNEPDSAIGGFPPGIWKAIAKSRSGLITAPIADGGPDYITAWQAVQDVPMVLAVSMSVPEAIRGWRRDALLALLVFALVAVVLGAGASQIVEQLEQRARAESELARQSQELAEAQRLAGVAAGHVSLPDLELRPTEQLRGLFDLPAATRQLPLELLLHRLKPSDAPRLREAMLSCRKPGDRFELEVRGQYPDGRDRLFWCEGLATTNGGSGQVSLLTVFQDVTEQRRAAAEASQWQRLAAIGRLTGGVAHDFNNLLSAILSYNEFVRNTIPPDSPARRDVDEIHLAATRAAALTQQLLAFGRKQLLQPRVILLNDLIRNLEGMLRRLIGEDIEIVTQLDPELGRVNADPVQMEQVLVNLAVNARDAMPHGGRLVIETANVVLDESYAREHAAVEPGRYVRLTVSDNGVGMDKETLSHIFEPFFSTKAGGQGTGLGLATVYGIVKQTGGHVWAYSEAGVGATFKVYLPLVDAPMSVSATGNTGEHGVPGNETLLLVEDEAPVRQVFTRSLESRGYRVFAAANAMEALELYAQHRDEIDLVVSDLVMPGMSGRDLVDRLHAIDPRLRVLYVSGYTDDGVVLHGVLESKLPYLQKPFTPLALANKVREVLDAE
jgi:signal transduction histidine kinase